MLGWVLRVIGVIGFFVTGELLAAALCIIALVTGSQLEEDSFWRWIIGTSVAGAGIYFLFKISLILGGAAVVAVAFAALAPERAPQ